MELPMPHVGLIIRYEYLWHRESKQGQDSGAKERPCAIILATEAGRVMVAPITHLEPDDPASAVEIPIKAKKRLGLDSERSWIICSEVNEFSGLGRTCAPSPISRHGLTAFYPSLFTTK